MWTLCYIIFIEIYQRKEGLLNFLRAFNIRRGNPSVAMSSDFIPRILLLIPLPSTHLLQQPREKQSLQIKKLTHQGVFVSIH